jgi:hypothetical protein
LATLGVITDTSTSSDIVSIMSLFNIPDTGTTAESISKIIVTKILRNILLTTRSKPVVLTSKKGEKTILRLNTKK